MSQITIQCRLVASVSTRQYLWKLMAEQNTPLINELLEQLGHHPDLENWRQKARIPADIVKQRCLTLKTDSRYSGQPSRFYASVIALVNYTYKSWLALMKRLQSQLDSKTYWLEMLKSDAELVKICGASLDGIRTKATEILTQIAPLDIVVTQQPKSSKVKKSKKSTVSQTDGIKHTLQTCDRHLFNSLFEIYRNTEDILTRCAISYLLKNSCKVSDEEEDCEKFTQRRRKVEIQIERIKEQLEARIPKGRDLTNTKWLQTLFTATSNIPENETEAKSWQNSLLRQSSSVPFPVAYESSEEMTWFKNQKGRICVKFNGISEDTFEVYCDNRQLHWFKRFLEDQQIKRNSKNQHSSSLFTLRSGRIAWQEGEGKGEPWNVHSLTLYCCVDTRLWTAEGTEQVKQERAEEIAKIITRTEAKGNLNSKQERFIKQKNSTLSRINNSFPRPSQPLYKGKSHILVGVSLGLKQPATVAVVDGITDKVITYHSIKQLLGDNYKLLNRQQREKQTLSHKRQIAQIFASPNPFEESELGQYIDRLLAKKIVALAQTYSAGSIVLPKLGDIREQVNSEIQARSEQKCPDCLEAQKNYAKQYRHSVHQWSYGRLIESVKTQAAKAGIVIEQGKQPIRGSPQQKAKELAIAAYKSRQMVD
ncbi:hypothetical protein H1Q63_13695 [Desmonostoc muscorum CCALA 125]|nr:hypothetical protein [Desmonostoc muscorum CCALA 125]